MVDTHSRLREVEGSVQAQSKELEKCNDEIELLKAKLDEEKKKNTELELKLKVHSIFTGLTRKFNSSILLLRSILRIL